MAILWVREKFLNREGSGDVTALREYSRIWHVGVDSLIHDVYTILRQPVLPALHSVYVGSDGSVDTLGAKLHKYTGRQIEDFVWEVTGHYTNQPRANRGRGRDGTEQASDPNPLNRPTQISVDGVIFTKPMSFTPDRVAICSSTGERFDPPVERDDSRRTYTFTRIEAQQNPLADTYKDVLNSDTWLGNPPGTAKCGLIKEVRADENNQLYWRVTYPIAVDGDGWDAHVMDVGTHWNDGANKPRNFTSINGDPVGGSHALNGEGGPLYPQGDGTPGACSKLAGAIGTGDQTITVTASSGWPVKPATYPIVLLIDSELMQAGSFSGTVFSNVIRGFGGSLAAAHANNAVVQMQPYFLTFKRYGRLPFAALHLP